MGSCKEIMQLDSIKTYTIEKDKHFSDNRFPLMLKLDKGIEGQFVLDDKTVPIIEHDQINKLVGLSVGTNLHANSLRLGWMYSDGMFHIYAYVYYKLQRHWKLIKSIKTGQKVSYFIAVIDGTPVMEVDDLTVQFDFSYNKNISTGALLFPYYGGLEPAPNTLKLKLSISSGEI